jgi:hypothetical protein
MQTTCKMVVVFLLLRARSYSTSGSSSFGQVLSSALRSAAGSHLSEPPKLEALVAEGYVDHEQIDGGCVMLPSRLTFVAVRIVGAGSDAHVGDVGWITGAKE